MQLDASPDTTSTGSLANTRRKHGFTLKLVTLDEGLYKGRQVLVIEKVKPFPFLKLSSEIRNQIYEDVLGGLGAQIRIVSRESCNPVRPDISTDACGGWEEKWEGQPSPVVISRVCKQIWYVQNLLTIKSPSFK